MADSRESEKSGMQGTLLQFRAFGSASARHKLLCISCAHRNHEFTERAPATGGSILDADRMPRAWIDGRGYVLIHHVDTTEVRCTHCGEEAAVTYGPEERCA